MSCARGVLFRPHQVQPGLWQFLPARCKRLSCDNCGPKKAAIYRAAIHRIAILFRLNRLVTLTLDPGLIPKGTDSVEYINDVFKKWKHQLTRAISHHFHYVRVLEFQKNGTAHFHLLIAETIAQDTLLRLWVAAGGGHQVRIRFHEPAHGAAYITKYLTKHLAQNVPQGKHMIAKSDGIVLFPKKLPTGWQWANCSFAFLIAFMEESILETTADLDRSGYFESFRDPPWLSIPVI